MQEIHFSDNYYHSTKYSDGLPQVKIDGVNYSRGTLLFNFSNEDGKVFQKQTRDPLEMLVLSEILYGSALWKYNASVSVYNGYNSTRELVGIKVTVDESYINDYKDSSVGFKVYLSTVYNNLKSYGGYDSYPKVRDISYLPYFDPIVQPKSFKVDLFDYQKKSVAKMLAIEKGTIDLECNYNIKVPFGEVDINYNPNKGCHDETSECKFKIKTKGGVLADEMGLGKTITSLTVVAMNPSTYTEE